MSDPNPLVAIVDDDESVRESLPDLVREFGFTARAYPSAEAFLSSAQLAVTACVLLDIVMPGMSGPELFQELRRRGCRTPTVFITALGDVATHPGLLQEGAVECLLKPFSDEALLAAIERALRAA